MWFTKRKKDDRKPKPDQSNNPESVRPYEQMEEIRLIKGSFSAIQAADILLSLINEKLKYHTVKSLNLDQNEQYRLYSKERINQLKNDKKTISDLVVFANKKGLTLEIDGTVSIYLIGEKPKIDSC